jgi:hypothetical protein
MSEILEPVGGPVPLSEGPEQRQREPVSRPRRRPAPPASSEIGLAEIADDPPHQLDDLA